MKRFVLLAGVILSIALMCAMGIGAHGCDQPGLCTGALAAEGERALLISLASVAAGLSLLTGGRVLWLLSTACRGLACLPIIDSDPRLIQAAWRTGVQRVLCVRDDGPSAFVVGVLRPHVVVSDSLVAALSPDELAAVLHHEAEHARRRDTLRQAIRRAGEDVLFFLPVLGWWSGRQAVRAELAADRAAIAAIGVRPVAGALWTASDEGKKLHAAAARLDQLTGEPATYAGPGRPLVLRSVAGVVGALGLVACVTPILGG